MKPTNLGNIKKLIAALEEFKKVDTSITLPSILSFLYYADIENNSGNRTIVMDRLNMSGATASRATLYWCDFKAPRVKGKDMLNVTQDPFDRRANCIQYNRKGKELIDRIAEAME